MITSMSASAAVSASAAAAAAADIAYHCYSASRLSDILFFTRRALRS